MSGSCTQSLLPGLSSSDRVEWARFQEDPGRWRCIWFSIRELSHHPNASARWFGRRNCGFYDDDLYNSWQSGKSSMGWMWWYSYCRTRLQDGFRDGAAKSDDFGSPKRRQNFDDLVMEKGWTFDDTFIRAEVNTLLQARPRLPWQTYQKLESSSSKGSGKTFRPSPYSKGQSGKGENQRERLLVRSRGLRRPWSMGTRNNCAWGTRQASATWATIAGSIMVVHFLHQLAKLATSPMERWCTTRPHTDKMMQFHRRGHSSWSTLHQRFYLRIPYHCKLEQSQDRSKAFCLVHPTKYHRSFTGRPEHPMHPWPSTSSRSIRKGVQFAPGQSIPKYSLFFSGSW